MPIAMASAPFSEMHYTASDQEEEEQEEAADENEEDDDDYSFSLSGFLEEDAFVDPAMLSPALDDSGISFTFSTENAPPDTTESSPFDFSPASPDLLKYVHASCAFGSPHAYDDCARLHNINEDSENAALVPFKISGSWRAESSFRDSARHSESRCSFSFLTDLENGEELSEESLMHFKGATMTENLGRCSNGEDTATLVGTAHAGEDGKIHMYNADSECDGEAGDEASKYASRDDNNVGNVQMYTQSTDIEENSSDLFDIFAHYDDNKQMDKGLNLPNPSQSTAEPLLRFAGEGLLQPWSSSKLSKSGKRQTNTEKYDLQQVSHASAHILNHLHPFEPASVRAIKDDFDRKPDKHASSRMQSESALFAPSGLGSPTHAPICMPRKSSGLFARRMMRNTSETLSLLVHAQRANTSLVEAVSSPGSAKSSSYRTSSIGSTQSSGYSSSSGKCSSTPSSSRTSSKSRAHIAARWSLQEQMDAEPFTSRKIKGNLHEKLLREEDTNPEFHRKGDKMHKQGIAYMQAEAAQSKGKTDPLAAVHGGVMPPSTSSQSPRSPLSWRSLLSLQPLNPSHVPLDQWELILGKPSSRSQSQKLSRSSSRGGSSKEGGFRNPSNMSVTAISKDQPLALHASGTGMKPSSLKGTMKPASTQKLVKKRAGYWPALNPMQWFKQCRNDQKQVVLSTTTSSTVECK